jgi:hypothetical protein
MDKTGRPGEDAVSRKEEEGDKIQDYIVINGKGLPVEDAYGAGEHDGTTNGIGAGTNASYAWPSPYPVFHALPPSPEFTDDNSGETLEIKANTDTFAI